MEIAIIEVASVPGGIARSVLWAATAARLSELMPDAPPPSPDQVLRARRIQNIVFTGVAANACVESTLREAYHREYFCLLLEDATHHAGPPYLLDATLWNVRTFFGWTATVAQFAQATQLREAA